MATEAVLEYDEDMVGAYDAVNAYEVLIALEIDPLKYDAVKQ